MVRTNTTFRRRYCTHAHTYGTCGTCHFIQTDVAKTPWSKKAIINSQGNKRDDKKSEWMVFFFSSLKYMSQTGTSTATPPTLLGD